MHGDPSSFLLDLELKDFRAKNASFFNFAPGLNLLLGKNGSGKTTLLEALYLSLQGQLFRPTTIKNLIHKEKDATSCSLTFSLKGITQRLTTEISAEKSSHFLNEKILKKSDLLHMWGVVTLKSTDLQLISAGPEARRHFFDRILSSIDPLYLFHYKRYKKGIKEAALLLASQKSDWLQSLFKALLPSAKYLIEKRTASINEINESSFLKKFPKGPLHFNYAPAGGVNELESLWKKTVENPPSRGISCGPHRDRIEVCVDKQLAAPFLSEGELKKSLFHIKQAEIELIHHHKKDLILLYDDIGSTLDSHSFGEVLELLKENIPTFISLPRKEDVDKFTKFNPHILSLEQ